jgi:hypothetical protein
MHRFPPKKQSASPHSCFGRARSREAGAQALLKPSKQGGADFKQGANMHGHHRRDDHGLGLLPVAGHRGQDLEQRAPQHPDPVVPAADALRLGHANHALSL